MHYHNFDILITPLGDASVGAPCHVSINSPVGQTVGSFQCPPVLQDDPDVVTNSPDGISPKVVGQSLFRALFKGEVHSCFDESLGWAGELDGLSIRIQSQMPELGYLPWELLYDSYRERFLSLSMRTPVTRFLPLPVPIRPLKVQLPLRVLIVVASPKDYANLDQAKEKAQMNSTLATLNEQLPVEITTLSSATLFRVQETLRRGSFDVLHFSGHARPGVLILEDESGNGREVSAEQWATLLQDSTIRLAVLNGCETTLSLHTRRQALYQDVTNSISLARVPAVVAMQYPIYDRAAITFARAFYPALAEGYPVEACIAEARKALSNEYGQHSIQWHTPVLYLRAHEGYLFDLLRGPEAEHVSNLQLAISVRLDFQQATEQTRSPEIPAQVRAIASSLIDLMKSRGIAAQIEIRPTFGTVVELLTPCSTTVLDTPAFEWRYGSELVRDYQEALQELDSELPLTAQVSLHGPQQVYWHSDVQYFTLPKKVNITSLGAIPHIIKCPEHVFEGLSPDGTQAYWWELEIGLPIVGLDGPEYRKFHERAYLRKLTVKEHELFTWLLDTCTVMLATQKRTDDLEGFLLKGAVYEHFGFYDQAIDVYTEAERQQPQDTRPWSCLQCAYLKKAYAVLGPDREGLLRRPIARFAAQANVYRQKLVSKQTDIMS